jgi:xyloglucan:xyloglucosyl transferase
MAMAALLFVSMGVRSDAQGGLAAGLNAWTKNVRFARNGRGVELVLDPLSAAGAGSKSSYLFGGFGAWIKLPPRDSSGTVTTFYMSSPGPKHCEFDFEFLGNRSHEPFLLHTNIFVDGVGGREQQIYLGFDPSAAFHYYSFQWSKDVLVFYVDNTPIRMFKNLHGVVRNFVYPGTKPMGIFLSIWDGSSWATQGGAIPINWASAPFVATYQNFRLNGCEVKAGDRNGVRWCQGSRYSAAQALGMVRIRQMRAVRANQVIYNYCDDRRRYPHAPLECAHNVL